MLNKEIHALPTSSRRLQASLRVGNAPSPMSSVSHNSVTSKLALTGLPISVIFFFNKAT